MPQAPAKPLTQRKRTRKRKRRAAFSSSSSSSDTSESDGEDDEGKRKTAELKTAIPKVAESSSSSESDSETSSSSSEEDNNSKVLKDNAENPQKQTRREWSPSPSPPPADLPSFLPPINANNENKGETKEQELKKKFRQFWMSSVADAFRDDLEELRKEQGLGTSRLALLIDSLAAGADVFSSSSDNSGVNEMDVVLS